MVGNHVVPSGTPADMPAASVDAGSEAPVLEVSDLRVTFPSPDGPVDVVKGVSFSLSSAGVVGIVGESGSGKTMTALAIAQLSPYPSTVSGSVRFHGHRLSELSRDKLNKLLGANVGFVFQNPMSALNPARTLGGLLTVRARVHLGLKRRAARAAAVALLDEVQMPSPEKQMKRYAHELSGGMQQRGMIAMALMNEPTLLICDEPTTALDVTIQAQIMDLLADINLRRGTAIILISHNLALTAQNCERILVMYAGRIVEDLDQDQLLNDPLHPYTTSLLTSLPVVGESRDTAFVPIPGDPPDRRHRRLDALSTPAVRLRLPVASASFRRS